MKSIVLLLTATLALGACVQSKESTVLGTTAAGAAAGALINDKNRTEGAVIGGVLGAVAGAVLVGNDRNSDKCLYRDSYGREFYAECPR